LTFTIKTKTVRFIKKTTLSNLLKAINDKEQASAEFLTFNF